MEQIILQLEDLCYSYGGDAPALEGLSLKVRAGERIAVLGGNGAGKSTLFLCCNGVLHPQKGQVIYEGQPMDCRKRRDRLALGQGVGIVFQQPDEQIIAPTVLGDVAFGPLNLGFSQEEARKRAKDALCQLGLEGFEERAPQYLSGGEKKRVTIAGVLAMEPKVLLLDEPAAALDPQGAWELEGLLEKLHQKGLTLMVATHDVDFAYGWADRCLVMEKGRLLADLPPWELFKQEELLEKAHLRPPFLFRAARALGMEEHPPRTIEELEQRIKGEKQWNRPHC